MRNTNYIDPSDAWKNFVSTGDETYLSELYYVHFDLLYAVGTRYTSDRQIIEDSIQNIFVNLLKKRTKLPQVTKVRAYIIKSFRRQLFLDLKKQKRLSFPEELPENQFEYHPSAEHNILKQDAHTEILAALKKSLGNLSPKQQEIIYLRFDCDLSYEEISTILEISVDSCYKSVYRAIKIVKSDIETMLAYGEKMILLFITSIARLSGKK